MDAALFAQSILRRWADAIAVRDLDVLAQMFAENALFIATAPAPLSGRAAIRDYYDGAPIGLTVQTGLILAAPQGEGINVVADVTFDLPAGRALHGRLSLACTSAGQISLYHLAPAQS